MKVPGTRVSTSLYDRARLTDFGRSSEACSVRRVPVNPGKMHALLPRQVHQVDYGQGGVQHKTLLRT